MKSVISNKLKRYIQHTWSQWITCHLKATVFFSSILSFGLPTQKLLFIDRKRNALRCPLCNSVRRGQKTEDLWNNLLLNVPINPPSGCKKKKIWTVNCTHILAHSQVRRRLRCRPGPMAHRAAWSCFSPGWPMAHRSLAHMTPLCVLPLLSESALNPGECRHHWRPDTGGIGRPLSSAELTGRYRTQTFSPSARWPCWRCERRRSAGWAEFFPSPTDRGGAGARQ